MADEDGAYFLERILSFFTFLDFSSWLNINITTFEIKYNILLVQRGDLKCLIEIINIFS